MQAMRVIAYACTDPLLESDQLPTHWGWEVGRIYQDFQTFVGGSKATAQPQLAQLLRHCQEDPPDLLLVRHWHELGQSPEELGHRLATLNGLGIAVQSTEAPIQGIETLSWVDIFKLLQSIQFHQRSRRIQRGHAQKRIKTLPPPGKAPYGYRRGKERYVPDRSTAPIVKVFFERFLIYGSLRGAVRYLSQKYGKTISATTGRRWLTHPVYRGDLAYRDGTVVPGTHIPLISREEAAQVDRILRRNQRLPPRTASAPRSLAGLVFCARCYSPMIVTRVTSRGKKREYLYLRPSVCPQQPKCRALAYDRVLEKTIGQICQDLPRAVNGLSLPTITQRKQLLEGAIASKQDLLAQLPTFVDQGILDEETVGLRAYKLRTELASLQGQLAELPPVNLQEIAQAVTIPQFWQDLSEPERRFFFREFIQKIQVHPQNIRDWTLEITFIF